MTYIPFPQDRVVPHDPWGPAQIIEFRPRNETQAIIGDMVYAWCMAWAAPMVAYHSMVWKWR